MVGLVFNMAISLTCLMLLNPGDSSQSITSVSSCVVHAQGEQETPNLFPQDVSGKTLTDTHGSKTQLHSFDRLHYLEGKIFHLGSFDNPVLIDKDPAVLPAVSRKQWMLPVCQITRYQRHHKAGWLTCLCAFLRSQNSAETLHSVEKP